METLRLENKRGKVTYIFNRRITDATTHKYIEVLLAFTLQPRMVDCHCLYVYAFFIFVLCGLMSLLIVGKKKEIKIDKIIH